MVLTEETAPSPLKPYRATFEDVPTQKVTKDDIAMERELFGEDVLQPTRSQLPVELRDKDPGNKKCSLLKPGSSNNGKVPYKILKVTPGDKFNIGVQYYYRPEANKSNSKNLREDILKNLLTGILGIGAGASGADKEGSAVRQNLVTSPYSSGNALQRFTDDDNEQQMPGHRPRAYLNYVLMDTAMQFIKGGALRVGEMDTKEPEWKNLVQNDIEATQLGYFLVYISNEEQPSSNLGAGNVYFDNLVIITNEGPVMEEDHYYPFGLLIHPISTTGSGRLKNNYKFQGQELNDNFDVYYYEFKYRQHDLQIGRFTQIDPLSDKYEYNSTYAFSENKVTNHIELEGLEAVSPGNPWGYIQAGFTSLAEAASNLFSFKSSVYKARKSEVSTETKTSVATLEAKTVTTLNENGFKFNSNINEWMMSGGKINMFDIGFYNNTKQKTEEKLTATIPTSGAPLKISLGNATDIDGSTQTLSVGTGASLKLNSAKLSLDASVYYSQQKTTTNDIISNFGLKGSMEYTYFGKPIVIMNSPTTKTTVTTQTTYGANFNSYLNFKWW